MRVVSLPTNYYQQFDADHSLDVPGEGYGGWKKEELPLHLDRTALVVMHAAYCGTKEEFPGHFRAVEYLPRSYEICRTIFPELLGAVRDSNMKIIHIGMGETYCKEYPGYQKILNMSQPEPAPYRQAEQDQILTQLREFMLEQGHPGAHNTPDIMRGYPLRAFPKEAEPVGEEPIALTSHQLFTWCKQERINHLVYIGFAINWCLLMSPGGMLDMSRHGILCSAIRQAVTAVENKETARLELNKELGLWRVALAFGFVYDVTDFVKALKGGVELIFDSHLHLQFTKQQQWDWRPATNKLLPYMELHGITHTCIMPSSTYAGYLYANEDDMTKQAETLCNITVQHAEQFFPLLHITPTLPLEFLMKTVDDYIVNGPIIGVKFSITMFADDERLDPFYDHLERHHIPVLFHSWYKTVTRYPYESTPAQIAKAAAKHPSLRILMAHVTGCRFRGIQDIKPYPNIFIDTSGSQPEDGYLQKAVDELGVDRVLFGSDYPIRAFSTSLARIDSIQLDERARNKILFENALTFYRKGVEV